jgi:hypothetical protein
MMDKVLWQGILKGTFDTDPAAAQQHYVAWNEGVKQVWTVVSVHSSLLLLLAELGWRFISSTHTLLVLNASQAWQREAVSPVQRQLQAPVSNQPSCHALCWCDVHCNSPPSHFLFLQQHASPPV